MSDYFDGMIFEDRSEAGRLLAGRLEHLRDQDPIVLAVPRGGVPVGYEVARALRAPLDVVVARKIGAPFQKELGIGAIAPDGICVLDDEAITMLRIRPEQIEQSISQETVEMARRIRLFRGSEPSPVLKGRTVILVDNGIATGVTTKAAIRSARKQSPRWLVLAVPVCPPETFDALAAEVDEFVCLLKPMAFGAVGLWYRDFAQVSDDEVVEFYAKQGKSIVPNPGSPFRRDR